MLFRFGDRMFRIGAVLFTIAFAPALLHADEPKPAKYALLVGVKDYEHPKLPALQYTENDVTELASVLRTAGYKVVLLTNTDGQKDANVKPTLGNIEKQLKQLLARCKKTDTVLVAFAGHGVQFEKIDDSFFCPQDAVPLNNEESRKTLLSITSVYQQLERSKCAVKLLLVDACRNNPEMGRGVVDSVRPPAGVAALFSCRAGERAYEHNNYRHGVFFYHVLEGLRGKAKNSDDDVTWDTLQAYVRKQVSADVRKLFDGVEQTPSLTAGELSGVPPVLIGHTVTLIARARLGIFTTSLNPTTAEQTHLRQQSQPQLIYIVPGGGGDAMGLKRGDVVRRVNGRDVKTIYQFDQALHELTLKERVELVVQRADKTLTLTGRYETSLTMAEELRRTRNQGEKDDAAALYSLGRTYERGATVPKDEAKAATYYRQAANLGLADAQCRLGILYASGRGVTKDDAEALRWCRKAADQGHAVAQHEVGSFYHNGRGVAKDDVEAVKWYRKAAEQENRDSQTNLGHAYKNGQGVAKDDAEAVKWYRKAAEQGQRPAQNQLGVMYRNGRGVAQNDTEAVTWFRKAAEQGNTAAQNNLGSMYEKGRGVTQDVTEAVKWYRKAAAQNHDGAVKALKRLGMAQ